MAERAIRMSATSSGSYPPSAPRRQSDRPEDQGLASQPAQLVGPVQPGRRHHPVTRSWIKYYGAFYRSELRFLQLAPPLRGRPVGAGWRETVTSGSQSRSTSRRAHIHRPQSRGAMTGDPNAEQRVPPQEGVERQGRPSWRHPRPRPRPRPGRLFRAVISRSGSSTAVQRAGPPPSARPPRDQGPAGSLLTSAAPSHRAPSPEHNVRHHPARPGRRPHVVGDLA